MQSSDTTSPQFTLIPEQELDLHPQDADHVEEGIEPIHEITSTIDTGARHELKFLGIPAAAGILKKPNISIFMTPVGGDLHFISRKAWDILLYHAQQQTIELGKRYRCPLRVFKESSDIDSNDLHFLKDRITSMIKTVVEWGESSNKPSAPDSRSTSKFAPVARKSTISWEATALLADAGFETDALTGEQYIWWGYSTTLTRQILDAFDYTKLSLMVLAKFRTIPALTLYELAMRYESSEGKASKILPWQEWVRLLRQKSIDHYPTLDFRRFNSETLKPALAQVNTFQNDFKVTFIPNRGKKVTHLQLYIQHTSEPRNRELRAKMNLALFGRICALGINQYSADTIYGSCSEYVLSQALAATEKRKANPTLDPIRATEGYLKDRIRKLSDIEQSEVKNAVPQVTTDRKEANKEYRPAWPTPSRPEVTLAERLDVIGSQYKSVHRTRAKAMFQEALQPQKDEWLKQFEAEKIANAVDSTKKVWETKKLASSLIASLFYGWLSEHTWNPKPSQNELMVWAISEGFITAPMGNPSEH